jgi:hypothetical protein
MTVSGSLVEANGAAVVPGVDESADGGDEVGHGGEVATAQRLAVTVQVLASLRVSECR